MIRCYFPSSVLIKCCSEKTFVFYDVRVYRFDRNNVPLIDYAVEDLKCINQLIRYDVEEVTKRTGAGWSSHYSQSEGINL